MTDETLSEKRDRLLHELAEVNGQIHAKNAEEQRARGPYTVAKDRRRTDALANREAAEAQAAQAPQGQPVAETSVDHPSRVPVRERPTEN
jgi:hypothetical protein